MASLNHVCIWSEKGWTKITALEAARLHPGGSVSAHSGLFMCELCGQYVTLANGEHNAPHFRHSSDIKSKDCPEHTFAMPTNMQFNPKQFDLPIRIVNIKNYSFDFELGLIQVQSDLLSDKFYVIIQNGLNEYKYTKERFNLDGTTYLFIGSEPCSNYTLIYPDKNNILSKYWSKDINGIDINGTIFEKNTGKRLPMDSDIEVNKEYYLLTNRSIISSFNDISINRVSVKKMLHETISLYMIKATALSELAAKFFLGLHYRLTARPIDLQPVWPLYIHGEYVVKYNQNKIFVLLQGNASELRSFPNATTKAYNTPSKDIYQSKVYELNCSDRQQLISAGRTKALKYMYLWKEKSFHRIASPEIIVKDINDKPLATDENAKLPSKGIIKVWSEYDGKIVISNSNDILNKYAMPAQQTIEVNHITYDSKVEVIVGLDVIWEINFKNKKTKAVLINENELLSRLEMNSEMNMRSPHSLSNILIAFSDYPKICNYITKCIKQGNISEKSFRIIQNVYLNILSNS